MGDGGWEGVMEGVRRGRRQTQGGDKGGSGRKEREGTGEGCQYKCKVLGHCDV